MNTRPAPQPLSPSQKRARRELDQVARDPSTGVRVIQRLDIDAAGLASTTITLDTRSISRATSGTPRFPALPLAADEQFTLIIGEDSRLPPHVLVDHARWVGFPHVMGGYDVCLYLDPSREWDPRMTVRDVLARLWDWLTDAAAGRFDARTSLYHAVGGYNRTTAGTLTLEVRALNGTLPRLAHLKVRTPYRTDLVDAPPPSDEREFSALLLPTAGPLHVPSGSTFNEIAHAIEQSGTLPRDLHPSFWKSPRPCFGLPKPGEVIHSRGHPTVPQEPPIAAQTFVQTLTRMANRHPERETVTAVLLVPHPVNDTPSLLALRMPAQEIRDGNGDAPVEWLRVSDERHAVTTRRDHRRPAHALFNKHVLLMGCGGIGSWLAEYIARAGARTLVVLDEANIDGGLLTRQNYGRQDVGDMKDAALARRIRAINDVIDVRHEPPLPDLDQIDLIVDATVSRSVGAMWTEMRLRGASLPLIARVSTDAPTGSLGLVTICPPGCSMGPEEIDEKVGKEVDALSSLEPYRVFWRDMDPVEALIPTLGCSVPTYHGSAADLAAVSSTALNFICRHLSGGLAGSHLFALPYSGVTPAHQFVQTG